ncbi:MAG TPA: hypothetical protein VKV74_13010 [Bryobacteraceae bacterium]|nr:hypothetical protein [Bryobacteraceae bacterium]
MKKTVPLAAALLAACSHPAQPGPKIDPALAGMIPSDTRLLAGARLEAIQKTAIYKKYLAGRDFPAVDRFAEQMKIDPRKDLWELLYVSNGSRSAVLGRGMFSDESEPRIPGHRFGYRGFNLVGDDNTAVLLVSPTFAAIGDTAELKALVDARDKSPGAPAALAAAMKDILPDSQLWAACAGDSLRLPFAATGNLANLNNIVQAIQSGSFYLDLRMGLAGVGLGRSRTERDSQELEAGLKALIGLGRLSTPQNRPELQRIWDGIRVTQQDRETKLYIDQPEELVGQFLSLTLGRAPDAPKAAPKN